MEETIRLVNIRYGASLWHHGVGGALETGQQDIPLRIGMECLLEEGITGIRKIRIKRKNAMVVNSVYRPEMLFSCHNRTMYGPLPEMKFEVRDIHLCSIRFCHGRCQAPAIRTSLLSVQLKPTRSPIASPLSRFAQRIALRQLKAPPAIRFFPVQLP